MLKLNNKLICLTSRSWPILLRPTNLLHWLSRYMLDNHHLRLSDHIERLSPFMVVDRVDLGAERGRNFKFVAKSVTFDSTCHEDEYANPNSGTGHIGSSFNGLGSHVSRRPESAYICYTHHGLSECSYSGPHFCHSAIGYSSPSKAACVSTSIVRSMPATAASATPSIVADFAWYPNSEATTHMTCDPTQFTDSRPYHKSVAANQSLPQLATVSTFGQQHQRLGHSSLPIINQTDDGGEFRSFDPYHKDFGIAYCLSYPHTSKQNGLVERRHRQIVETGLVLLAQASLPFLFWTNAFYSDVHLINMLPTKVLNGISPIEKLFGRRLENHQLRVFKCLCFPLLRPYNRHKLQYRSTPCTFLGSTTAQHDSGLLSSSVGTSVPPIAAIQDLLDGLVSPSNVIQQVSVTSNIHPIVTGSKVETYKIKAYIATVSSVTPTDIHEAMAIPSWQVAVHDEIQALVKNNTWDLVPSPPNRSLVGCKWLFKVKTNPDGSVAHNKVCLIAQGFSQAPGLDYHEMFCPVVKANIVHMVLALAVSRKWKLRQVDVNNAFLNRDLAEDIYMKQPIGFEVLDGNGNPLACRLNKEIYRLKQASRAWFEKLKGFLT
ncbi:Retrovirus-related Pol polyprotein from transposon TNT 1-94 [Gossypium australe]|uniref:Retrovirus-related Pol polyprotein from transposon TNT 1-94 n=1 Tax=Gossypium australe TaxID=47621 RepID=A0A5B6W7W5_9ROSI|nr:Retrovirus-related Pol polyprotein from transposon TNT 1-94 [Gossypium australe]